MKKILLALVALTLITACSQKQKKDWGLAKEAPNEFLVVSRAPLTLPPDYDLRPINDNMTINQEDIKYQGLSSNERALMQKIDNREASSLPDDDELLVDESNEENEEIERELQNLQDATPLIDDTYDGNDANPQGE